MDNTERLRLYQGVNELIVTRVCGVTPLRHEARHWLIKPNIIGMRENLAVEDVMIAGDWAAEYWGLSEQAELISGVTVILGLSKDRPHPHRLADALQRLLTAVLERDAG